jgi:type I restriction enzyme S subunit
MMERWELPKGWSKIRLNDEVIDILSGFSCARKYAVQTGVLHLRPFNIGISGELDLTQRIYIPEDTISNPAYYYLQSGDILFNNTNSVELVGKSAIVRTPMECTFSNHLTRIRIIALERLEPQWLLLALRSLWLNGFFAANCNRWIGQAGFAPTKLAELEIPAPPLAEQRRIAARLETLLGEARALRAEVQSMRRDLAQVMESALAEAFNLDEKTPKWSIATIANVKGGKRLPKGETFAEGITPYPYIRVTDFQDFSVRIENLRYLKPETHQKIRRYTISKDDVYISIAGTIGLVGIIPERLDGANLTENAAKIVFRSEYRGKIIPKYLAYFLVSPDGKKQIEERSKAAGQPKLALERIETIEIPEVDVSEQRRIVASLERIAEETRALDTSLAQDLRDLEALEQSILAAAFRGEV